ncbi:SHOCT domain-containing protein [Pontibacillus marinus]|nr:SHOCT domain-containing protein [Pontibacillus marinus]
MNGNGMGGFFGGMGITWILIIGILIIIAAIFFNKQSNNSGEKNNQNRSLETLKERLAKGEITEEEYDRLKQKLDEK